MELVTLHEIAVQKTSIHSILVTYYTSPRETALASYLSRGGVQAQVHQLLAGKTSTYLASDVQRTADTGRPQLRSTTENADVLFRAHTTVSVTEVSCVWNALLSYLRQDINYRHFKQAPNGTYVPLMTYV